MVLTPREKRIYNRLAKVFAAYLTSVPEMILQEKSFDISQFPDDVQAALIAELHPFYLADVEAIRLRDKLPDYNEDMIGSAAAAWARNSVFQITDKLVSSTVMLLQKALSLYQETPGMTREDVIAIIQPAFSKKRAQSIAVTETTRASAAAVNGLQNYYRGVGLSYDRQWGTNYDDIVCQICSPLNGKYELKWSTRFPEGPPAHPKCRCFLVLRRR